MIALFDWRQCFPLETPRPEQERALDFIVERFLSGDSNVVAGLAAGVGKSAIAVTMARWFKAWSRELVERKIITDDPVQSYILTSQKILQDQYSTEFRKHVSDIRSSSNFECVWMPGQTCGETSRLKRTLSEDGDSSEISSEERRNVMKAISCRDESRCPYRVAKEKFKASDVGITNYSYFLSETVYAGGLKPRTFMVCDEGHNIEDEVRKWATVSINEKFVEELKLRFPTDDAGINLWIRDSYVTAVSDLIRVIATMMHKNVASGGSARVLKELSHKHELLDKHVCQVNRYLLEKGSTTDNYLIVRGDDPKKGRFFELKPLEVGKQANTLLYSAGQKRLFMSATVLDFKMFIDSLGIAKRKTSYLTIASPFPKENRPIFYVPVGSMSRNTLDRTLPELVRSIKKILNMHPEEKGIIHTHNYKIANYVRAALNSDRILSHDSNNREAVLEKHMASSMPTVLLSPSMSEGVDLRDDASRFQIICKMPYSFLGDPVVLEKKKRSPKWYAWMTIQTLVQGIGRSIRSSSDYAVTYILDSDFDRFYQNNKGMFPEDFGSLIQR